MPDTENKAGAGTIPADEMDVYKGWTSQQGPEPEPLPSTGPQKYVEEQLPATEDLLGYGEDPESGTFAMPENQIAESAEELDPADQVRLGNVGYASPLGVVANPEGAHIPGESGEEERIRSAPELLQAPEPGVEAEEPGVEAEEAEEGEEKALEDMTKQELCDYADAQGYESVSMSMSKDEILAAIEEAGG